MNNDLIFHIKTGGTIGGCVPEYVEIEEASNIFGDTVSFKKHIVDSFKIKNDYSEIEICQKDSRDINSGDREEILQAIKRQYEQGVRKFLITHGTFTMEQTINFLEDNLSKDILQSAIIILTGSMYPWVVYGSDAPMNLGASLTHLIQHTINGIYVCMHGRIFNPGNVQKDEKAKIFRNKDI